MLTAVPGSLPPLTPILVDAEDPRRACASRKKLPPATAKTDGAAPASTAGASGTSATSGTAAAKGSKGSKGSGSKTAGGAKSAGAKAGGTTSAKTSASGYAAPRPSSRPSSAAAKKTGPLAFLDDPKLSMEEKLLKLLGYLNDKWNKDLDQKMKEFKQTSTTTSSTSGKSSGLGGIVKKAVGFASKAIPQLGVSLAALQNPTLRAVVKNVAGPALAAAATAAGQPQLAPLALRYGPEIVDMAAEAGASTSSSGAASLASSSKGSTKTTTKETADGLGSDRDAQLKLMEMQRILDQQKEMFSLVSNLMRTTHETRMAVVQNVR